MEEKSDLFVEQFSLHSSSDVIGIVERVSLLSFKPALAHVVAFIHNTVLVQNLKVELLKKFPDLQIVFLKSEDKKSVQLTLYGAKEIDAEPLSSLFLERLYRWHKQDTIRITEYRNKLFQRYFTDNLTMLPNLYQLRKDLEDEDVQHGNLVLFKIDNFQMINNFYGFVVGDYVIEYISELLKEHLNDLELYRLSGTEFATLLADQKDFYELREYLIELYNSLQNLVVRYRDIDIFVNMTIASSVLNDKTSLFSKASMALKYAQENQLPFWIYEDTMNLEDEYEKNLSLSKRVIDAVQNDRIVPYYQAIYDNKAKKITKYESLARLIDSDGNIIGPDLFIPITKSLKIYDLITQTIIEKSFKEFENNTYDLSINLSIEDVMNTQIFNYIIKKLQMFSDPSRITFELLESEAIQDFHKVSHFIKEIKRRGAKIAIDDFGSGYSNFSYIINLHVDYIKIDGSLIENIVSDTTSKIAVETIVELAKKLGVKTVAEYVMSSSILAYVQSIGIDYSQGFIIDKPSVSFTEEVVS